VAGRGPSASERGSLRPQNSSWTQAQARPGTRHQGSAGLRGYFYLLPLLLVPRHLMSCCIV
jgi:hypothetical protein